MSWGVDNAYTRKSSSIGWSSIRLGVWKMLVDSAMGMVSSSLNLEFGRLSCKLQPIYIYIYICQQANKIEVIIYT